MSVVVRHWMTYSRPLGELSPDTIWVGLHLGDVCLLVLIAPPGRGRATLKEARWVDDFLQNVVGVRWTESRCRVVGRTKIDPVSVWVEVPL